MLQMTVRHFQSYFLRSSDLALASLFENFEMNTGFALIVIDHYSLASRSSSSSCTLEHSGASVRPYPGFCRTVRRRKLLHVFQAVPYAYGRTPYLFYPANILRNRRHIRSQVLCVLCYALHPEKQLSR